MNRIPLHTGLKVSFGGFVFCVLLGMLFLGCRKDDSAVIDDTFFLRHEGADMPVYVHGNRSSKTFILSIHGAGSFGLALRNGAFTDRLEKEFAVVYWDQRGQGTAQGNYPETDDILSLMASDIIALVEVLKAKYGDDIRLVLMGHSLGGLLGLEALLNLGLQNDPQVKGWISISGVHDFAEMREARHALIIEVANTQIAAGLGVEEWTSIRDEALALDPLSEGDYDAILSLASRALKRIELDGVVSSDLPSGLLGNILFQNNPLTYFVSQLLNQPINQALENNYSLTPRLPDLATPSLWLYGRYDFSVPPVIGEAAYAAVGSEEKSLVIFDHSAHWLFYTEAEAFGDEVIGFVYGLP